MDVIIPTNLILALPSLLHPLYIVLLVCFVVLLSVKSDPDRINIALYALRELIPHYTMSEISIISIDILGI